jgi:hypothetical protein
LEVKSEVVRPVISGFRSPPPFINPGTISRLANRVPAGPYQPIPFADALDEGAKFGGLPAWAAVQIHAHEQLDKAERVRP